MRPCWKLRVAIGLTSLAGLAQADEYDRVRRHLKPLGGHLCMPAGRWDPFQEICDNGIDPAAIIQGFCDHNPQAPGCTPAEAPLEETP